MKETWKGRIREYLRPEEARELHKKREEYPLSEELERAFNESNIIIVPYCCSYIGTDLSVARKLLYVPGEIAEEADEVLHRYRTRVTEILQPLQLCSSLKIRPVVKGQIEL